MTQAAPWQFHIPLRASTAGRATVAMALWAALLVSTALVTGCASGPIDSAKDANRKEIATESDQPDERKRARIRLELASNYFSEGKTTIALDEIKQALLADPTFGDAFNLRGLIYMRLNDPRLAEESFKRALALNSRDPDAAHNIGWLMCQQRRYPESQAYFNQALGMPLYADQAKTFMTQGICQMAANQKGDAERSLSRSYELDAANPITGYNLASLLYDRAEYVRSQFYIRRLNNSEYANAESLWLGIKVERRLDNQVAIEQLVGQLKRRFPQSRELSLYDRGAFNE
jgi:type IV pilus assembly protein PilF